MKIKNSRTPSNRLELCYNNHSLSFSRFSLFINLLSMQPDTLQSIWDTLECESKVSLEQLNQFSQQLLQMPTLPVARLPFALDLYMEMVRRYAQVVPSSNKRRSLYTTPALLILENLCIQHYYHYREIPKGVWKQIYFIYQRAQNGQFNKTRVQWQDSKQSADKIFQRILLLNLAKPYNLSQSQQQELIDSLRHHHQLDILELRRSDRRFYFYIDLRSDHSPAPHYLFSNHDLLCIDLYPALQLIPMAYQHYQRQFQRYRADQEVNVVFGLENIFDGLKNQFRAQFLEQIESTNGTMLDQSVEGINLLVDENVKQCAIGEICALHRQSQFIGLYRIIRLLNDAQGRHLGLRCLGKNVQAVMSRKGISSGPLQKQQKTLLLNQQQLLTPQGSFEALQCLSVQGASMRLKSPPAINDQYSLFHLQNIGL